MENKSLIKENIFTNKIKRILFNLLKKLKIKKNDDYDTKKTNKNAVITDVYKNNQIGGIKSIYSSAASLARKGQPGFW